MMTATAAPLAQTLLPEIDHEIQLTRRVLERLPEEKFGWQPHPKSMTVARLATHTADLLSYIATTLETPELDFTKETSTWEPATTSAALLQRLENGAAAARAAVADATNEAFAEIWTMRNGEQVYLSQPRAEVVRHLISHMVHHRAQLMVYLRLLDVPVPGIYGPSADEMK